MSQRTNVKLHAVAGTVTGWALGHSLPQPVARELDAAVGRCRARLVAGPAG
ncbi:hypothetical protein ACH4C2_30530 [Streptomyces sp. NPDC018057]|uniref:hypothetical protein n=1 Tax=unclassified Streptomyces TaxID=2593676 RepID=UPI0037AA08C0